jgi:prepilin-type N-terminal cleavage/methylation domain-containing protein
MKKKAFSLVEILIVMGILTLLSLATLPSLGRIGANRLNTSGNQFVETLVLAKTTARQELGVAMVAIDNEGKYRTYTLKKNRELPAPERALLPPGTDDDFYVDPANNNQRVWVERQRWGKLSDGIVWSDVESSFDITNRPVYNAPLPSNVSNYVIFEPDGSVPMKKRFRMFPLNNTNNYYDVYVVKETGSIKVDRR